MRGALSTALLAACGLGCSNGPATAAAEDAGARDARAYDSAVDPDGGDVTDASVAEDGSERDAIADAAGDAAATCDPVCVPSNECVTATCVAGACEESPVDDATTCGEMSERVCVRGSCLARGCGNGLRETTGTPREGCDDGNVLEGDGCSPMCTPTAFVVEAPPSGGTTAPTRGASAIAPDGFGSLLFVWTTQSSSEAHLVARRYTAGGAPVPAAADPIAIDGPLLLPTSADPVVAGLPTGGWVVAWIAERSGSRDIVYRLVASDGSLSEERIANAERTNVQEQPRIATLDGGFVIAWTNRYETTADPYGGIYARRFDAAGAALGGDIDVVATRPYRDQAPALAARGSTWAVSWFRLDLAGVAGNRIFARRFGSTGPIDATEVELAADVLAAPEMTATETGGFAIAWATTDAAATFHVNARLLAAGATAPGPLFEIGTGSTARYENPALASLGGDDIFAVWEQPRTIGMRVGFGASPGAMLMPEAMILAERIALGAERNVVATTVRDGVWVGWRGYDGLVGDAFSAFFLPRD